MGPTTLRNPFPVSEEIVVDRRIVVLLVVVAILVLMVVLPVLVSRWMIRRDRRRLVREVQVLTGDGGTVLRVAAGRAGFAAWQTAVVAGLLVLSMVTGDPLPGILLVLAVVLWAVWTRPRLIATTDHDVVLIASNWSRQPLRVLARVRRTDWHPRRSLGSVTQAIGGEAVVLDTFGQRDMLPDGSSGEPRADAGR